MSNPNQRPDAPREGSGTTNRVVEDAIMGPAETALEEEGERPPQSDAEALGGNAAGTQAPGEQKPGA